MAVGARHPDQRIAAFVHGGVIGAALAVATRAQNFAINGSANGAISRLVLTEGRMVLRGFNDCASGMIHRFRWLGFWVPRQAQVIAIEGHSQKVLRVQDCQASGGRRAAQQITSWGKNRYDLDGWG